MLTLTPLDYINVGKAGTFADAGVTKTMAKQVDELFEYLTQKNIDTLLVYFHGGLVSEKSGLAAAEVMVANFTKPDERRHAVSFVWETGPKEVILQNFDTISKKARSSFYEEATKFVIKLAAKHLGITDAKGGGGEYLSDATIKEEKEKEAPFEDLDRQLDDRKGGVEELSLEPAEENELQAKLNRESMVLIRNRATENFKNTTTADDPHLTPELNPTVDDDTKGVGLAIAKVVAKIAFRVLKRFFKKTHHDFYPTVMEETFRTLYVGNVGTWGWNSIKDKAHKMFSDNTGLSGEQLHAGSYFLNLLQQHYNDRIKEAKPFKVHLVGHSAGSIVICYLVKSVMDRFKDLRFESIFFLAPACRIDLFLSHCKPAIETGHFKKFKMFTMKTEKEKKDHCIPVIYTHSLLYLVSGLFEVDQEDKSEIDAKIMGLNEQFMATGRYADFPELTELNNFLKGHDLVLSDDLVNENLSLRCGALKHGDFDNDELTLTAILKSL